MHRILIVEDSRIYFEKLSAYFHERLDVECINAKSLKDAAKVILDYRGKFELAVVDLILPDSQNGEVIDLVSKFAIPTIALTGHADRFTEDFMRTKKIIDFISKEDDVAIGYMVWLATRIINNRNSKILIVDDSKVMQGLIEDLIKRYAMQCLKAADGLEALDVISKNPDIKLIFTDYHMPKMDGLAFTKELRKQFSKETMAVVAVTSDDSKKSLAHFLKAGANDYITKPFTEEEFYARLNATLEILELFKENKIRVNTDFLTGAFNRRYLFETFEKNFNKAHVSSLSVAILDIDHFKKINDTYGHDIGDIAIKECTSVIMRLLDSNSFIVRLGGEEFCVVCKNKTQDELHLLFEKIRKTVEDNKIVCGEYEISYTVSLGLCIDALKYDTLVNAMAFADSLLYQAKADGRNRVVANS